MMLHGHEASYQENNVFEDSMFWVSGLSAVKGLQILKAMEIKITELEPNTTYANPNLPDVVITDINNALNMGWRVIVPEETGGLPAFPYIKYDPATGSAGYMIATMAGGFSWEITPTGYEADLTFMKDILMEKNIKITYEVLDPPSPYLVAMGNYFLLVMKVVVEDVGGYGVRVIERNMIRIDTNWRNYRSDRWPPYTLFPGEYKIMFDGKELFKFYVIKMDVETYCETLPEPYKCEDSFIAKRDGARERITVRMLPKDIDNAQVNWTCEDTPDDNFNSGTCNPSSGNGFTFEFIPKPNPEPSGRSGPLSYSVKAEVTLNGITRNITKIIKQGNIGGQI